MSGFMFDVPDSPIERENAGIIRKRFERPESVNLPARRLRVLRASHRQQREQFDHLSYVAKIFLLRVLGFDRLEQ